VNVERERIHQIQRSAIWKWRWLGLRNSTPGFKGSLLILAVATGYIVFRVVAH
jgi:hypothetical protein